MHLVNSISLGMVALLASCGFESSQELDVVIGQEQSAVVVCSTGPTTFGIDVSRFQYDINWSKVAGEGVKFAYIQISRKINDIDAKFEFNWAGAKSVGILRGAYQRFQPDQDVQKQASIFLDKLGPFQPGDLPPMLDVEDTGGLPAATIANRARQWLDIVEAATGVRPIIYTNFYFWRDSVNSADFTDYPLWIAHYTTKGCPNIPAPWTNWAIHQYSDKAKLAGITDNTVDVNLFNGTVDDLLALAGPPVCGDGVCTGSETTDSCQEDCPPCQRIAALGDIVDEKGPCFEVGGAPESMRKEEAGHDGSLRWTHATDSAQASNYGVWNLFFEEAGKYLVEAHTPAPYNMSKQAAYQVQHGAEQTVAELDQSAIDGWSPVGEFQFEAGAAQSIRLDDNTGESFDIKIKLVFDAIRFTRLDPLVDDRKGKDPDPDEDEKEVAGGCQSTGSSGSSTGALLGLALLLGLGRRRRFESHASRV